MADVGEMGNVLTVFIRLTDSVVLRKEEDLPDGADCWVEPIQLSGRLVNGSFTQSLDHKFFVLPYDFF
jgi:hypothetical protein